MWQNEGVALWPLPIWAFAIVAAALAPWCVQAYARALERRIQRRTETVLRDAARAAQHRDASTVVQRNEP